MDLANTALRWGLVARIFHWLVALLVVVQVGLGWASERGHDRELSMSLIRDHYQFGVVLFALVLMRLAWRVSHAVPGPPLGEPAWRTRLAEAVHGLLYVLLLTMPISGYVIWVHMQAPMDVFGLVIIPTIFTPPTEDETLRAGAWYVHFFSGWILIGLTALQIAAAAWHQFVAKDRLLDRMPT